MKHVWARGTGENYLTEIEVGPHRFTADEPPALGGGNRGPAPYDLLLGSLGACTAITLPLKWAGSSAKSAALSLRPTKRFCIM